MDLVRCVDEFSILLLSMSGEYRHIDQPTGVRSSGAGVAGLLGQSWRLVRSSVEAEVLRWSKGLAWIAELASAAERCVVAGIVFVRGSTSDADEVEVVAGLVGARLGLELAFGSAGRVLEFGLGKSTEKVHSMMISQERGLWWAPSIAGVDVGVGELELVAEAWGSIWPCFPPREFESLPLPALSRV